MNIAIVDDHQILTYSLKAILAEYEFIHSITTYNTAASFLESNFAELDVVLLDLIMPEINGLKVLEIFQNEHKGKLKFIVLSVLIDPKSIRQCIKLGARGYLSKTCSVDEVATAVSEVNAGRQYIGQDLHSAIINTVFIDEGVIKPHLSPREQDVLTGICNGNSIKQIASEKKLSVHTAQYYYRCILAKLKIKKKTDLIIFAIENGLYNPDVEKNI